MYFLNCNLFVIPFARYSRAFDVFSYWFVGVLWFLLKESNIQVLLGILVFFKSHDLVIFFLIIRNYQMLTPLQGSPHEELTYRDYELICRNPDFLIIARQDCLISITVLFHLIFLTALWGMSIIDHKVNLRECECSASHS